MADKPREWSEKDAGELADVAKASKELAADLLIGRDDEKGK